MYDSLLHAVSKIQSHTATANATVQKKSQKDKLALRHVKQITMTLKNAINIL